MFALWLCVLAALARAFSLPGWFGDWMWPLIFISVMLRIMAWEKQPRLWVDFVGGLVYWVLGFSFLLNVHVLAPLGAAVILASCWVVEALLYRALRSKFQAPFAAFFALPTAEFLRMKVFYLGVGGVPWASMGLALEPSPLYPYARVFGEAGLVVLAVGVGVSLWAILYARNFRPSIVTAILLIGGSPWLGSAEQPTETLRCLSVQPNVSVRDKNILFSAKAFFEVQKEVTWEAFAAGEDPELIIWAETMWPYPGCEEGAVGFLRRPWPGREDEIVAMDLVALRQKVMVQNLLAPALKTSHFLTGAHFYYPVEGERLEYDYSLRGTEFLLFNHDGHLLHHFSKQELVPFGESLPFGGNFPGAEAFRSWAHKTFGLRPDFNKTEDAGPLSGFDALPKIGGTVCWENVFEAPYRRQANAGAQVFVILSNEDWFGEEGLEMHQMVAATRLRAAEAGLAMLRTTNTGYTCLVKSDGEVVYGLEPNIKGWWGVDLPIAAPDAASTPYRQGGWLLAPIWAAVGLLFCLIVWAIKLGERASQRQIVKELDPS